MRIKKCQKNTTRLLRNFYKDTVAALLEKITGVNIRKAELLEPKMQITDEREADFILNAQLKDGGQEIYHIEFQGCVCALPQLRPPFPKTFRLSSL
ncbi:MAG: hypothetical protein L3V56_05120 [Candidatus Magnetoovum sp. WYHC-5]|nr:hypothetical protein [Candidatus Magnetoovum sp. WYHC-5]